MPTAAAHFLDALLEAGITHCFVNWGSDHPALIEAVAQARAEGRPLPQIVTCPNEMVALSAAHGFALVSGRAQAVIVHVDCGTQALAGAVHNADRGRAPVLIFAGASPLTQDGEQRGSRNEFIQWLQDVHDQRGLVRGYMRYDAEIRTGATIKQHVHRALQFAHSDPKGPVYLMAAREILEQEVPPVAINRAHWRPIAPAALAPSDIDAILADLSAARRPLLVTSYAGRNPAVPALLVQLCERLGVGVLESAPAAMNFPANHELYLGNQWNQPHQNEVLAEADAILVLDSDVPWIPTISRPAPDATIHHIDVDPLKAQMPLWYLPTTRSCRADAETALHQLLAAAPAEARRSPWTARHTARAERLAALEIPGHDDAINGEWATAQLRPFLDDQTIVLSEGISHYHVIADHLRLSRPGSLFTSGASSLGWSGGAAIGAKLADPDATLVVVCGDGSYMFSVPSSVHWIARHYATPFLTVILNNRGWKSPKLSALAVHPDGFARRANDLDTAFDPPPDYAAIAAAAGGALALTVRRPQDLEAAYAEAFRAVREQKRCAVLDIWVPHL